MDLRHADTDEPLRLEPWQLAVLDETYVFNGDGTLRFVGCDRWVMNQDGSRAGLEIAKPSP